MPEPTRWNLHEPPPRQRGVLLPALVLSILAHGVIGQRLLGAGAEAAPDDGWVELAVHTPPPPPPPEPEPEAAPKERPAPKPRPAPEPVHFEETVPAEALAEAAKEEPRRAVRRVQGLSATSFAQGSGTGLSVRAGNTTATQATSETAEIGSAGDFDLMPVGVVTTQPGACSRPPVEVPVEAIEAGYEGTLRMRLDLDATGRVTGVTFLDHAGHGVQEACRDAALRIQCRPARHGGQPVAVTGMPHRCTIRALE